jgi:hypothetical protein
MPGVPFTKFWWSLAAVACLSCRSHEGLCEGADCLPASGGQASASAEDAAPAGAAGEANGGAASALRTECARDEQCQNDSACDGVERCVEGRCEGGDAPSCEHGTACAEQEMARCVYETPSPWLLTIGTGTIRGLPIAEIGKQKAEPALPTLATREVHESLTGFASLTFSPDGRVALIHSYESQFGSSMQMLRFGRGLPSELLEIPDLPSWGDFSDEPQFSADSTRALISDSFSGVYIVDLTEERKPTQLVAAGDDLSAFRAEPFCKDASSWVQYSDGQYSIATEVEGKVSARPIGYGHYQLSPDGNLVVIAVTDEDSNLEAVRLYSCSGDAWVEELEGVTPATFSPTSKELLLGLAGGGLRILSLEEPQEPTEIWADPSAQDYDYAFTADGSKLLFERAEEGAEDTTIHAVDLSDPSEPFVYSLRLPLSAEVAIVGEAAILAWSTWAFDEPRDLLWQTLRPQSTAEPRLVLSDPSDDVTEIHSAPFDPESVLLGRLSGEQTTLTRLRYDGSSFEQTPIVELPGTIWSMAWTPDGRGVAIQVTGSLIDTKSWWFTFSETGQASQPLLLAPESLEVRIQPWF